MGRSGRWVRDTELSATHGVLNGSRLIIFQAIAINQEWDGHPGRLVDGNGYEGVVSHGENERERERERARVRERECMCVCKQSERWAEGARRVVAVCFLGHVEGNGNGYEGVVLRWPQYHSTD